MPFFRKSRTRIRDEAADWMVRLGEGRSEETEAAFRRWRDSDPRNAEAFARISRIWTDAPDTPLPDGGTSDSTATSVMRYALAASLAAAAVLAAVLLLAARWPAASAPDAPPGQSWATAVGEIRQVELADGSRLVLDSASRVDVRLTGAERRLILREGRARFAVARDRRPFVVHAGSSEVVATGTTFDVSVIGGRTAVLLLEGSVEVRGRPRAPHARQRLEPGQKLVLEGSRPVRGPVVSGETAWTSGMLEFDDTPLAEASALANRYGGRRLALADARMGALRVSGAYRAGDMDGLAHGLAAAFDLRVETTPDGDLLLVDPDAMDR